jgi:Ubiquitin carboxyl-terminal hydrolase
MRVRRFPPCLVVHINRFKRSALSPAAADRWIKFSSDVRFPVSALHLGPLSTGAAAATTAAPAEDPVYDLYAVINHYGSRDIGHYTAHCKVAGEGGRERWLTFDDDKVTEVRSRGGCRTRRCMQAGRFRTHSGKHVCVLGCVACHPILSPLKSAPAGNCMSTRSEPECKQRPSVHNMQVQPEAVSSPAGYILMYCRRPVQDRNSGNVAR